MPVKITSSSSYFFPVEIPFRNEAGKVEVRTLEIKFRRLSQDECEALMNANKKDRAIIEEVVIGWKEGHVQDEHGETLPFTPTNLEALCNMVPAQPCIVRAFFNSLAGGARAGN